MYLKSLFKVVENDKQKHTMSHMEVFQFFRGGTLSINFLAIIFFHFNLTTFNVKKPHKVSLAALSTELN